MACLKEEEGDELVAKDLCIIDRITGPTVPSTSPRNLARYGKGRKRISQGL